jgi:uncharacterized protein (DUF488 family)
MATFYTIGHSNRSLDELIEMLREVRIGLLVDVRSFPRSRTNPVFNIDILPDKLSEAQISYRHCSALGGRRPRQKTVEESLNALWRVQSFHNYADYALGDEFGAALSDLVELGSRFRIALMCSEAVWWRCHRRIITDYLLFNGHDVDHLMAPGDRNQAKPTPGAVKTPDGKVLYPQLPNQGTLAPAVDA